MHNGYVSAWYDGRKVRSHRMAWELFHGAIPAGMFVLHRCDNRACCNPEHLFLGTAADNTADMLTKRRAKRGSEAPWAKLTENDVLQIRELLRAGIPQADIARNFGVHQVTVSKIHLRKQWTHV